MLSIAHEYTCISRRTKREHGTAVSGGDTWHVRTATGARRSLVALLNVEAQPPGPQLEVQFPEVEHQLVLRRHTPIVHTITSANAAPLRCKIKLRSRAARGATARSSLDDGCRGRTFCQSCGPRKVSAARCPRNMLFSDDLFSGSYRCTAVSGKNLPCASAVPFRSFSSSSLPAGSHHVVASKLLGSHPPCSGSSRSPAAAGTCARSRFVP